MTSAHLVTSTRLAQPAYTYLLRGCSHLREGLQGGLDEYRRRLLQEEERTFWDSLSKVTLLVD